MVINGKISLNIHIFDHFLKMRLKPNTNIEPVKKYILFKFENIFLIFR